MYERYKELRDERNVTDYKVSQDTGISTSTLTDWKKKRYEPKVEKLQILAEYFGVPIEHFLKAKVKK